MVLVRKTSFPTLHEVFSEALLCLPVSPSSLHAPAYLKVGSGARDIIGDANSTPQLGLQPRTAPTFDSASIDTLRSNMSNMTTQLLVSTPLTLTDSTPGFFEILPRELRDNVYDTLYQELDNEDSGIRFQTYTVCTELCLVSRQFRTEYDERTSVDKESKQLTVIVNLSVTSCWCNQRVVLPSALLAARIGHLTLMLTPCDGTHMMDGEHCECNADDRGAQSNCYKDFVQALVRALPRLQSLHVSLHAPTDLCLMNMLPLPIAFTESPKLKELKIMSPCLGGPTAGPLAQVAIWTEKDGMQQDQEAIELCRKRVWPHGFE